jgi:hypothetical protein
MSKRTIPGTGLSPLSYAALVATSIALFLLWDGPLWSAPREATHVGRFAVSYLAVIPLAAIALLASRRWSWGHLMATTGSAWAIKMVVTAVLYQAFATGTAGQFEPRLATPGPARPSTAPDYQPAPGPFAAGRLTGLMLREGVPVPSAVVYLEGPAPGRPLRAPAPVELRLGPAASKRPSGWSTARRP